MLNLLQVFHPFPGTAGHLLKLHALPHILRQPVGNGGCEHTDDGYLHTVDDMDGVGVYAIVDVLGMSRSVGSGFHDVRTEQRTAHLTDPFVVDLMAGLDVVIAHRLGIVLHVVDDRCGEVLVFWHHVVRPVDAGLSLQDVTVVYQQQVVSKCRPLLINICISP